MAKCEFDQFLAGYQGLACKRQKALIALKEKFEEYSLAELRKLFCAGDVTDAERSRDCPAYSDLLEQGPHSTFAL